MPLDKLLFLLYKVRILYFDFINFTFRSSSTEGFCKNGVLEKFTKFTGKHLCQSLLFNKVVGLSIKLLFNEQRI